MDRLKKARKPLRTHATRLINESNTLLAVDEPDQETLRTNLILLQKIIEDLIQADEKVKEQQLDDNMSDTEIEAEFSTVQNYQRSYIEVRTKIENVINAQSSPPESYASAASESASAVGGVTKKRPFKLPTITIKPFDGTLKSWLSWWGQFLKIHEDDAIDASDKFQYLSHSMQEGTEAKELISSYPLSAENYPRAVEALIERYGRDDLQLQFYVRELLTLVITNVTKKEKLPLTSLFLKLESHLRCLATLKLDQADPATWLFPLVESSLAEDTLRAWQRSPLSKEDGSKDSPTKSRLDRLMDFVRGEVRTEQQILMAQSAFQTTSLEAVQPVGKQKRNNTKKFPSEEIATAAGLISGVVSCAFCEGKHDSDRCVKAQSMSHVEKREKLQEKKMCYKCLRPGHMTKNCKWRVKCIICGGQHYTIMCSGVTKARESKEVVIPEEPRAMAQSVNFTHGQPWYEAPYQPPEANVDNPSFNKTSSTANQCSADVLLNTIVVKLKGRNSTFTVRLVGDTGSQRSYVRRDVVQRLGCAQIGEEWLQNVLFGGVTTPPVLSKKYAVTFVNPVNGTTNDFHLLERKEICGQLSKVPTGPWINELQQQGIIISDIGSGCQDVDILLGSDYWGNVLTGRLVKLSSGLVAVETIFGWTLSGRLPVISSNFAVPVTSLFVSSVDVSQLWSLEAMGIHDPIEVKSKEEDEAEAMRYFEKTVKRDESGRYIVSLPWKCDQLSLPSNRYVAERRLLRATAQLKSQDKFEIYDQVFREWEREEFISVVTGDDGRGHYLPHRPVFKEGSSTPVRPVFDASCKSGKGPSINDVMYTGPNLLELIPKLLLRFREKEIGVSADIRKAFQMLKMVEEDQPFQKFLWWEDKSCEKVKVYKHQRVVFGMTCSPFLLAATINYHLAALEDRRFAEKLRASFYVDNSVLSVSNQKEYEAFRSESVRVLSQAGMDLRQWATSIQDGGTTTDKQNEKKMPENLSLLGVLWDRWDDMLMCDVPEFNEDGIGTKRKVLSLVARIFDPIGFLAPATLQLKLLLQDTVSLKCGWDEPLPEPVQKKFESWGNTISFLREVKIPRHMQLPSISSREIHVFVDGSSYAYAAVIFLRSMLGGEVNVQLMLAKAKLAPITKTSRKATVPRLELMACLLGSRLATTVREALNTKDIPFYFWSDSTTALAWIHRHQQWGTFVGNRVTEILSNTCPAQWRHVPGIANPADLPSRGCSPLKLLQSRWWEGPEWLRGNESSWPKDEEKVDEDTVNAEVRKTAVIVATQIYTQPRFSSFRKNVCVWGWVLRFVKCARTPKAQRTTVQKKFLCLPEIRDAEKIVLRQIQDESFPDKNKRIGGMVVEEDKDNILRVQTRLLYRKDKQDFLHPILLPKKHPLVDMLIMDAHRYFGHAGTQFLISKLREKYWVLQTRRTIQRILKTCVVCQRHQSKPAEVNPAPLPELRVTNSEPFQTTGVDLAGPVVLKDGTKAWIVLFTCAFYRALHLDVVTSLSTEAFLGAMERFISVYGRPNTIYSDNGTNFHGAVNIFKQLNWKKVEEESNIRQIQWIFNPPSAAWWGGWWERLVRSVKELLRRILGTARLSYDEFRTCLAGVCATINERPLTVVTEDGQDLIPLTPAMFLRQRPGGIMPECINSRVLQEGYTTMKTTQLQLQDRFRKEYLSLLVQRGNERKKQPLQVGDVVLVGDDNRKRFQWPLGLILELMCGRDGEYRVAKVKTSRGVLARPIQRLFPLEVSSGGETADHLKSKVNPVKLAEVKVNDGESVRAIKTKAGRIVKRPVRYGQYFNSF